MPMCLSDLGWHLGQNQERFEPDSQLDLVASKVQLLHKLQAADIF